MNENEIIIKDENGNDLSLVAVDRKDGCKPMLF